MTLTLWDDGGPFIVSTDDDHPGTVVLVTPDGAEEMTADAALYLSDRIDASWFGQVLPTDVCITTLGHSGWYPHTVAARLSAALDDAALLTGML